MQSTITQLARIAWVARAGLAFMFFYHGLVPKLLTLSVGERLMITAHGFQNPEQIARLSGLAEIAMAVWLLSPWYRRGSLVIAATALAGLLADVAMITPHLLAEAFNPVSLNLAGLALCAVAWLAEAPVPRAHPA